MVDSQRVQVTSWGFTYCSYIIHNRQIGGPRSEVDLSGGLVFFRLCSANCFNWYPRPIDIGWGFPHTKSARKVWQTERLPCDPYTRRTVRSGRTVGGLRLATKGELCYTLRVAAPDSVV